VGIKCAHSPDSALGAWQLAEGSPRARQIYQQLRADYYRPFLRLESVTARYFTRAGRRGRGSLEDRRGSELLRPDLLELTRRPAPARGSENSRCGGGLLRNGAGLLGARSSTLRGAAGRSWARSEADHGHVARAASCWRPRRDRPDPHRRPRVSAYRVTTIVNVGGGRRRLEKGRARDEANRSRATEMGAAGLAFINTRSRGVPTDSRSTTSSKPAGVGIECAIPPPARARPRGRYRARGDNRALHRIGRTSLARRDALRDLYLHSERPAASAAEVAMAAGRPRLTRDEILPRGAGVRGGGSLRRSE